MNIVSVTIDYETWHPIPKGKQINWETDVFQPTDKLLQIFDSLKLPLTLMAEMGEYFWLKENRPEVAQTMEKQWVRAVASGHDVQLHLHPNWLPELGARFEQGQWTWDWSLSQAETYPFDLTALIKKCKVTLEALLKPIKPNYQVTSFRAGAYQAQPFTRLHQALVENGIFCDSSVYAGGFSKDRGYDYRRVTYNDTPYFAAADDPALAAPWNKGHVVELPIFTYSLGERWFLDDKQGPKLAKHLLAYLARRPRKKLSFVSRKSALSCRMNYQRKGSGSDGFALPTATNHHYFIMIGHSKARLEFEGVEKALQQLKSSQTVRFVTLSDAAQLAAQELKDNPSLPILKSPDLDVALKILEQTYASLSPEKNNATNDPEEILEQGFAWCYGYAIVMQHLLQQKGLKSRIVSIVMPDHPRGHGSGKVDSHTMVEIYLEGRWRLFDPTTNTYFDGCSLEDLVIRPELADFVHLKKVKDQRFQERSYDLYCTRWAFEKTTEIIYPSLIKKIRDALRL